MYMLYVNHCNKFYYYDNIYDYVKLVIIAIFICLNKQHSIARTRDSTVIIEKKSEQNMKYSIYNYAIALLLYIPFCDQYSYVELNSFL